MPFWPQNDGVSLDPRKPRALGICDYCGQSWHLDDLKIQVEWLGTHVGPLNFRVCPKCYDKPQEQLRTIILPPDPIPVLNPRTENYAQDSGLQGFNQNAIGNPLTPYTSLSAVLADAAANGWAGTVPATTDRSGSISMPFSAQTLMIPNPQRKFLLVYNPVQSGLGISSGTATFYQGGIADNAGIFVSSGAGANTTACGQCTALVQNASQGQTVWTGVVSIVGALTNQPYIACEG